MWKIDLYIFYPADKKFISVISPWGRIGETVQDIIDVHPGMSAFVLISLKKV